MSRLARLLPNENRYQKHCLHFNNISKDIILCATGPCLKPIIHCCVMSMLWTILYAVVKWNHSLFIIHCWATACDICFNLNNLRRLFVELSGIQYNLFPLGGSHHGQPRPTRRLTHTYLITACEQGIWKCCAYGRGVANKCGMVLFSLRKPIHRDQDKIIPGWCHDICH